MTESARATAAIGDALAEGRRKADNNRPRAGTNGLLGLQRLAGNAAVNALLAAKFKSPGGEAVGQIDSAISELRRDDPAIDTVEKGLKAAQAAGVPVEMEGPKPPASALAVTMTGFGPEAVAPPRPARPPKPQPAVHPLGKAGAASAAAPAGPSQQAVAAPTDSTAVAGAGASTGSAPATLSSDQLSQPPAPPIAPAPGEDPAFNQVKGGIKAVGADKRAHPTAGSRAQQAQNAAAPPSDDVAGQAKAAKVDTMDAQQAGSFDKKAFIAAVKTAIEAKSPKTLKEADDYAKSGKAGEVKGDVKGLVGQGKQGQAKDIETATAAEPDTSKAVAKPVTPMAPENQSAPPAIPGGGAAPKPAPPEQLNLEAGKQQANQEMSDAQVSEEQLAQSNEPDFQKALSDKQTAAAHADTAPGEYRKQEQDVIGQNKAQAAAETQAGLADMHGTKAGALAKLVADKANTKSKDEAKRAEVTARVQAIFSATETDVKKILDGIDPKVEKAFEEGEAGARKAFESYVTQKMSAYKEDRYSGWLGGLRWAKDKLVGMPDEVNRFYEAGREIYLKQMDGVISRVADTVGDDLTAAKRRIASGKNEIASYVKSLPANLKNIGADAAKEIGDKFEQLESDVSSKQESVVDTLASKYVEARKGLDDRIEELQAENKGLVDKAIGAIKAVINTIRQLAAMLMNTLARVAHVVGDIIKHPVRFLGNLVEGVKGGILRFKDNILDHLRKGLMGWLFGALAEGGVEVPDKFDLQGIIKLLLSLFGLTWTNIRNRIVKQIGEKAMSAVEKGVDIFQKIASGGVAALWQMLIEKLGDIKEMIMSQVKDFVVTKIITAGITWLIGLLNPAAAFIKACKLIYDIIMFFVTNGERIMKFVNTVIDSAVDIIGGNIGGVVAKIEDVLGQMVPILIGFLASVIGIGGIGEKIREILGKLQKPVNKAIDFVIKTGLKIAGPIIRAVKGIAGKVKAGFAKGKAWVKGKIYGGDDSPEGKQKRLELGVRGGVAAANRFAGKKIGDKVLRPMLGAIRMRHGLTVLEPVKQEGKWAVHGTISRMTETTDAEVADQEDLTKAQDRREAAEREQAETREALAVLGPPGTDPTRAEKLKALDAQLAEKNGRLDEIRRTKSARPGELEELGGWYLDVVAKYEAIRAEIQSLKAKPTQLQTEADKIFRDADNAVAQAVAALADPAIQAGLVIPAVGPTGPSPTPVERVTTARNELQAAIGGFATRTVTTAAQLTAVQALTPLTSRATKVIGDARNEVKAINQVRTQVDAVQNVYDETTNYGTIPDYTAEGAARYEVQTGQPVEGRWHGEKCRDYARNLTTIIDNLREQRRQLPPTVHKAIDEAIKRADDRRAKLQQGADVWYARYNSDPTFGPR